MLFFPPLVSAILIKRYKRFLADVRLESGEIITVSCSNTGAMTGCAEPGWKVWLLDIQNAKRKYRYSWELVQNDQIETICVNTVRANQVVMETIQAQYIPSLDSYSQLKREVPYGYENSRIDLQLRREGWPDCYVEVKSVTMKLGSSSLGVFPDSPSLRAQRHLRELTSVVHQGDRAVLLFAVMHSGVEQVSILPEIDPTYADLLRTAIEVGVEVIAIRFLCNNEQIYFDRLIPFRS